MLTRFAKKELHLSQLVRSRNAAVRNGPKDFKVGDVLHLMLDELETPFGDVGLRSPSFYNLTRHIVLLGKHCCALAL